MPLHFFLLPYKYAKKYHKHRAQEEIYIFNRYAGGIGNAPDGPVRYSLGADGHEGLILRQPVDYVKEKGSVGGIFPEIRFHDPGSPEEENPAAAFRRYDNAQVERTSNFSGLRG